MTIYIYKHSGIYSNKEKHIMFFAHPRCSMYEIVTYIYPKICPNVAEYSTRGASRHVCVHDRPSGKTVDFIQFRNGL